MKQHILLLLSLLAVACEAIPETEFTDRPVVCCYLCPGETPTLTVEKVIPFQSDAVFSDEQVDKLDVTITDLSTGEDYLLKSMGEGVYSNDALVVESGHEYRLSFDYDNVPVSAETVVPSAPTGVSFSATTIEVMSMPSMPAMAPTKSSFEGIAITWDNADGDYYIVEGQTSSDNCIYALDDDDDEPSRSFKLNYTQGADATLSSSDFFYYGNYQISIMHISFDYAVMSQGGSTSSTTLVDMKGNIDGGYGIFTGISKVTKSIKVVKGSSPSPF